MIAASTCFELQHTDANHSGARAGKLKTAHGEILTPVFMPVGTQATVKTVSNRELLEAGSQIILSNTYHLFLRPGHKTIGDLGGLHKFMGWQKPILTDSGGFQIFSLATLKKLTEEGVHFQSHIDGNKIFLTPEEVVRVQHVLGSDIMMPLDECVGYPSEEAYVEKSCDLTYRWLKRAADVWGDLRAKGAYNLLFGIIQGGVYDQLRLKSLEQITSVDLPGYAIGGLSVGEPSEHMYRILSQIAPKMPIDKPRYLMGVGLVEDLFEAVGHGVDMFDCVVPTRNGRNATVFTSRGKMLLRNSSWTKDERPIDEDCECYTCRHHTRAYLRHLFNSEEYLGGRLASLHNITFFIKLLSLMREHILKDNFANFKKEFLTKYKQKDI